jgi:hypothetical protein
LRRRQRIEVIEHRVAQLVHRCKRQLQLGFDAGDLCDAAAGRLPGAVLQ